MLQRQRLWEAPWALRTALEDGAWSDMPSETACNLLGQNGFCHQITAVGNKSELGQKHLVCHQAVLYLRCTFLPSSNVLSVITSLFTGENAICYHFSYIFGIL